MMDISIIDNDFCNGLNNSSLLIDKKLKVDRKKFETLLENKDQLLGNAETFFGNIMKEFPSVSISWPPKLKTGTKSKKDPHVKISGIPFMVRAARLKILSFLDPSRDRVTLKMDIDWTAHSHIIGKGGTSIQQVMVSSGCHVHFPDANRTNTNEKSNQVSIAGTVEGVKMARIAIRDLLPIIITFNILIGFENRWEIFKEKMNQIIKEIESLSCIQIGFRYNGDNRLTTNDAISVTILVRGVYGSLALLKLVVDVLQESLQSLITSQVLYEINTEISLQHHNFVMGYNKSNINEIMSITDANIIFPEPIDQTVDHLFSRQSLSSPQTVANRKTTIIIKSSKIESLLLAFHMIEERLPLSLSFDLKEGQEVDTKMIETLSTKYDVSISVKPKPKHNTKTVWIKVAEKDFLRLFQVRHHLIEEQETITSELMAVITNIWKPNESDPLELLTDKNGDKFQLDYGMGSKFNKAPGAERWS
ncbi:protein bicaudal C homolog 1-like [Oppia nitens]|uniref:protein bicaudal C homolog 1-like n=1 Tax=Oppia nitens TaxID=1686743 RepID=UPI0023DA936E|nr:protein bicaudal C homolog 1-like [Oppia nitens]